MSERVIDQDFSFVPLQTAVFCVQCELISKNSTPHCHACGSKALLSLSRVLGGSMQGQPTAHLISDVELNRLVRNLLQTVPARGMNFSEPHVPTTFAMLSPSRHHARSVNVGASSGTYADADPADIDLEPAISVITERAQALTRATGAAIALRRGEEIVCRARAGRTAPDLGVRLQASSGISGECVRTGEVVICNDAEHDHQVDLATCRRLGVRSILAAPLRHFRRTLGVFEVLSSTPHAFHEGDIATMQLLSSTMVAAISRLAANRSVERAKVS
jgi:GAF domain-containing protein